MLTPERKIPTYTAPWWSEELHKAHLIVKYWKIATSIKCCQSTDQTPLDQLKTEISIEYDVYQGEPKRSISGQLRRAIKRCRKCRNNSSQLRQQFLEKLAGEWVTAKAPTQAAIVCRIKTAERRKTMNRKLQTYLKPISHGGLTQVDIPE
eukprot:1121960-Ditylum_brightwellii.AAC.1